MPEGTPIAAASPVSATLGYASPDTADPWPRWIERGLVIAIGITMLAGAVQAGLWVRIWDGLGWTLLEGMETASNRWTITGTSHLGALAIACLGTVAALTALAFPIARPAFGVLCLLVAVLRAVAAIPWVDPTLLPLTAPMRFPSLSSVGYEVTRAACLGGLGVLLLLTGLRSATVARRRALFQRICLITALLYAAGLTMAMQDRPSVQTPQTVGRFIVTIGTLAMVGAVPVLGALLVLAIQGRSRYWTASASFVLLGALTVIAGLAVHSEYWLFPGQAFNAGVMELSMWEANIASLTPELVAVPLTIALFAAGRLGPRPATSSDDRSHSVSRLPLGE